MKPSTFAIGTVTLPNNVFLAPMAGVTDGPFRALCRRFGAGLTYTEMVSGKALHYRDKKTGTLLDNSGVVVATQLFGHEPEILAEAAGLVNGDIIDINMGCPAPKIVNNQDGSAMMKHPDLVGNVVEAVVRTAGRPVTVKIRKGWDEASQNAVEVAKIAEAAGAATITVHGRTREQFYAGSADWDCIRRVKAAVSVPVIGNGDVADGPSAKRMLDETGCDGVMIGRAAQGNPWIFREVLHYLATGEVLPPPPLPERVALALEHLQMLTEEKGEYIGIREGRKHAAWYLKGVRGSAKLKDAVNRAESLAQMRRLFTQLL